MVAAGLRRAIRPTPIRAGLRRPRASQLAGPCHLVDCLSYKRGNRADHPFEEGLDRDGVAAVVDVDVPGPLGGLVAASMDSVYRTAR
jgi:hypothetical protein